MVLDAIQEELRKFDLVPVIFDFELVDGRSMIETVGLLARMSRFVIADLTDAKLVLNELEDIVPSNPSLPIQPIISQDQEEPLRVKELRKYSNFMEPLAYKDSESLISSLENAVVKSANKKAEEIRQSKPGLFPA